MEELRDKDLEKGLAMDCGTKFLDMMCEGGRRRRSYKERLGKAKILFRRSLGSKRLAEVYRFDSCTLSVITVRTPPLNVTSNTTLSVQPLTAATVLLWNDTTCKAQSVRACFKWNFTTNARLSLSFQARILGQPWSPGKRTKGQRLNRMHR